ncbi:MAG: glycine zipper family protein [Pseudomonadota bacterium]
MLYYPHYTPSKQRLRSILLFSDDINLIVPHIDQQGVRRRGNVKDILDRSPELIDFKDPQGRYYEWANRQGVDKIISSLLDEVAVQIDDEGLETIRKDQFGHVEPGQDELIAFLWSERGWKYVAAEKFPYQIHEEVFASDAAARVGHFRNPVTDEIVEHNGVLCHPNLADFVLSRMAREASFKEGRPSVTFGGIDFMNHLYDGENPPQNPELTLFQSSLDLIVPDNLDRLDTDEYLHIRDDYRDLRRSLWSYFGTVSVEQNLHLSDVEQEALVRNLSDARDQIEDDIRRVTDFIGRQRFRSYTALALETASTLGGAAIGAIYSGPQGAVCGAGIGLAGGKYANRLSTVQKSPEGRLDTIAMNKAKIESRGLKKRWDAPSYWRD